MKGKFIKSECNKRNIELFIDNTSTNKDVSKLDWTYIRLKDRI